MRKASRKIKTDAGVTHRKTVCTACAIPLYTVSRTAGGRLVTVAGSSDEELNFDPAAEAALPIDSVSLCAKIAPNAATPSEPPICWKNIRELEATPMSLSST